MEFSAEHYISVLISGQIGFFQELRISCRAERSSRNVDLMQYKVVDEF